MIHLLRAAHHFLLSNSPHTQPQRHHHQHHHHQEHILQATNLSRNGRGRRAANRRFDVVVLDPPAFIRRKKDMEAGQEAYRRINRLAMHVLADDGILLTASCSSHLRRERLLELVQSAAEHGGRTLRVLEQGHQGADHPVHPGLAESDYLKAFTCRVSS